MHLPIPCLIPFFICCSTVVTPAPFYPSFKSTATTTTTIMSSTCYPRARTACPKAANTAGHPMRSTATQPLAGVRPCFFKRSDRPLRDPIRNVGTPPRNTLSNCCSSSSNNNSQGRVPRRRLKGAGCRGCLGRKMLNRTTPAPAVRGSNCKALHLLYAVVLFFILADSTKISNLLFVRARMRRTLDVMGRPRFVSSTCTNKQNISLANCTL